MIKLAPARRLIALAFVSVALIVSGCAVPPAAGGDPTPTPPAQAPAAASDERPVAILAERAYAAELAQPAEPTPTATRPALRGVNTPTPEPEPEPTPGEAAVPAVIPTPSPRPAGTPPRVGLQAGHWKSNELPDELARFRNSTGARWGNVTEAELNLDIVNRIKPLLEAEGVVVDIIPATVPPSYDADAFIAIHADGSNSGAPRGWKLATPWRASPASQMLLEAVHSAYGPATGMPEDVGGVTVNMKGYYAFNNRRHVHAIAQTTPGIIVEMGFMTSAADREILFGQPDRVARGIADGILAYLRQRDPNDGAALLPPDFPNLRAGPAGAVLRAAPSDEARVLRTLEPDSRVFVIGRQEGWYQVFARDVPGTSGWIREDQLVVAPAGPPSAPQPEPTSTNP